MLRSKKKLTLSAETLRNLRHDQLRTVVGGQTLATCSDLCSDVICPDTKAVHGCASGVGC
jgi:hypothetical protein